MNVAVLLFVLAIMCAAVESREQFDPWRVRAEARALDLTEATSYGEETLRYFNYYGLDFENTRHVFGTYPSDTFTVAAHVFVPESARATVYMVHGYYDHVGILKNAIHLCLEQNLCVVALDLPGHGMSSGERAAIDDFSQYAHAIDALFRKTRRHVPRPFVIIAHSIGCAAALEYIWTTGERDVVKLILLAPGLRSTYHGLTKFGHALWPPFADTSPRWFRKASHDQAFLEWFGRDPLQYDRFPLRWADAFYTWQDRLADHDSIPVPVTVIQGTEDDVVDWEHNLRTLTQMAPQATIIPVPGARHQLLNESQPWKDQALRALEQELRLVK